MFKYTSVAEQYLRDRAQMAALQARQEEQEMSTALVLTTLADNGAIPEEAAAVYSEQIAAATVRVAAAKQRIIEEAETMGRVKESLTIEEADTIEAEPMETAAPKKKGLK